jgi:hypothetical protein
MVGADGSFEDSDLIGIADLADYLATTVPTIASKNFLAILGNPYNVVHAGVSGMRGMAILPAHVPIVYALQAESIALKCGVQTPKKNEKPVSFGRKTGFLLR